MQTEQLTTTNILSLFETSKEERLHFISNVIDRLNNGEADPLTVHLQLKCMEDVVKQLTANEMYKNILLEAAQKNGKSFLFHNAKFEQKEVGVTYDFSKCEDQEITDLLAKQEDIKEKIKARQDLLKTVPLSGLAIMNNDTGELSTFYPPSKKSTTSITVTLK